MKQKENDMASRVLGHILSREELSTVMSRDELEIASGGAMAVSENPSTCTPTSDGIGN